MGIYKDCDIRGRYGFELGTEEAFLIGRAVGSIIVGRRCARLPSHAGGPYVIVGGDLRPSTGALKEALMDGLNAEGVYVADVGTLPTPAFYHALGGSGASGGVMVTASHSPPDHNGFKVTLGEGPITVGDMGEIEAKVGSLRAGARPGPAAGPGGRREGDAAAGAGAAGMAATPTATPCGARVRGNGLSFGTGMRARADVRGSYVASLADAYAGLPFGGGGGAGGPGAAGDAPRVGALGAAGLTAAVDCGNGAMCGLAAEALSLVGVRVLELFGEPDGRFPGRGPNPTDHSCLGALCAMVTERGADFGVAFDGDGDRAVFVDDMGRPVDGERAFALMVKGGRWGRGDRSDGASAAPRFVYDLKSSSAVRRAIEEAGGVPLMARSGHTFIKRAFLESGAAMAGEISGHFFFSGIGGDDGLFAAMAMAKLLGCTGGTLSSMLDAIAMPPITPDLRLDCAPEGQDGILRAIEALGEGHTVTRLDGVRIEFPDGWVLARKSVTASQITLRVEAADGASMDRIRRLLTDAVPETRSIL